MASENRRHVSQWLARGLRLTAAMLLAIVIDGAVPELNAQANAPQVKIVSIAVEGMSCVSCAARVKRTLKGIDGVQFVEVSLERREAMVRFSSDKVTPERLEAAINALGYKAGKPRVTESK